MINLSHIPIIVYFFSIDVEFLSTSTGQSQKETRITVAMTSLLTESSKTATPSLSMCALSGKDIIYSNFIILF